jgi:hypothetical protein
VSAALLDNPLLRESSLFKVVSAFAVLGINSRLSLLHSDCIPPPPQIFKRRLHKNDSPATPCPHLSAKKKASLQGMIRSRINKKKGNLRFAGGNKTAEKFNAK